MTQIVIRFKKDYGSEIFYKCMLNIKKQYPNKNFSELLIHLPIYELNLMFLKTQFDIVMKIAEYQKTNKKTLKMLKALKKLKNVQTKTFNTN